MDRLAYDIFTDIVRDGAYANLALKKRLAGAEPKTARRVTALVYTAIESCAYCDYLIAHYARGRLHGSVKNVLRLAITELVVMRSSAPAVINSAVETTRSAGKAALAGFVNAVLRALAGDDAAGRLPELPTEPVKRFSIKYGMPEFMVREYLDEYGQAFTEAMLAARLHKLTVRAQHPYTGDELERELALLNISVTRGKYDKNALILDDGVNVAALDAYKEGRLAVQSESAMLVCRACRVFDGARVLDACAAPGGKTAYLASLMKGSGSIEAWELHPHRAELISKTLERLKVSNCEIRIKDAAEVCPKDETKRFDIVLVDAPCSGLGGGTKPDALLRRTEADVASLAETQLAILLNAAELVAPDGALVYSTCTVSKRENIENAKRFLALRDDFVPDSVDDLIENTAAREQNRERGFISLYPHIDGTDGFFIARFIKKPAQTSRTADE